MIHVKTDDQPEFLVITEMLEEGWAPFDISRLNRRCYLVG